MYLGSRDNVSGMLRGVFKCLVDFLDRNVKKIRSVLLIVFLLLSREVTCKEEVYSPPLLLDQVLFSICP
jgi:hypothetical protein